MREEEAKNPNSFVPDYHPSPDRGKKDQQPIKASLAGRSRELLIYKLCAAPVKVCVQEYRGEDSTPAQNNP